MSVTEKIARTMLAENGESNPHPSLLADTMREVEYAGLTDEPVKQSYRHHGWTVQKFTADGWAGKVHFKGDFGATICGCDEYEMTTRAINEGRATCKSCLRIMDEN